MKLTDINSALEIAKAELVELEAGRKGRIYHIRKAQVTRRILALQNKARKKGSEYNAIEVTAYYGGILGDIYKFILTDVSLDEAKFIIDNRLKPGFDKVVYKELSIGIPSDLLGN